MTPSNAKEYLDAGASHVIVTSVCLHTHAETLQSFVSVNDFWHIKIKVV